MWCVVCQCILLHIIVEHSIVRLLSCLGWLLFFLCYRISQVVHLFLCFHVSAGKIKQVVRCLSFSHCTSVVAREPGMHRQPSCYMTIQRLLAYSILKYENDLTQMTMRNIKHLASFPQSRLSLLISVFVTDLDRADLITTCLIIIVRHCCPNCDCADKIFYTDWYLSTDWEH